MPYIIPVVAAAAAVGGVGAAGAAGAGQNQNRPTKFGDTTDYDPNKFNYGGDPNGANQAADRYRGWAETAQSRDAVLANYGQADQYAGLGLGARGQQQQVADMQLARAQGLTPSIAEMQANQQSQQAMAAQGALAASARGPGGLALAQQQAANNTANAQGQIYGQAQVNAANERMQAEQAAMQGLGGMRGADINSQQQAAQQQQYLAGLHMQQRQMNDALSLGMSQQERGVRQDQLAAGTQQQNMLSGSLDKQQQMNQARSAANAENERAMLGMAIGGGMGALQAGASGGGGKK